MIKAKKKKKYVKFIKYMEKTLVFVLFLEKPDRSISVLNVSTR